MNYNHRKYPLEQLLEKGTGTAIKNDVNSLSYEELHSVTRRIGG